MTLKDFIAVIGMGILCLLPSQSRADRLDVLETYPAVEYCKQVTGMFYAGADAKAHGFARKIEPVTPMIIEMIEHRIPLPKSAIWAHDWQQLNDREKEFMALHVFAGWDAVNDPDEVDAKSQQFFEACVRFRVAEKRI